MVVATRLSGWALAFAALGLAVGCSDPQGPKPAASLLPNVLPTGGMLAAATKTTGSDLDPNGYEVWVDDQWSQSPPDNGVVYFNGLAGGDHKVVLLMIAPNCMVTATAPGIVVDNPRTVTITEGTTGATDFDVGCASVGSLFISTTTTGVDLDADGYTLTVDGAANQGAPANGDVTFTGSATGSHAVVLSGVAGNCTVSGGNGQAATVTAGGMTDIAFSVSCTPLASGTGSLTVTTTTTGSNPNPNGYTLTIDGTNSQAIGTNATVTLTVPAGANPVALSGLAANCKVSGANPQTVTVTAGGTSTTTFAVTCGAPLAAVSGHVQLGWGSATPGNVVQVFDFDVRADLTGRFTGTDYGDVHPSGLPASVTTDPVNDPQTYFIAYRDPGPGKCRQPGTGVEFDAVGRGDEGDLRTYTVQICDLGPNGSGVDFLSFYIPVGGYGRSGVLTAGDIVKR